MTDITAKLAEELIAWADWCADDSRAPTRRMPSRPFQTIAREAAAALTHHTEAQAGGTEPHGDIFPTKEPGWPFPKGDKGAAPAAPAGRTLTEDEIRSIFLANGFTIKDGLSDLKPYVYQAARAILAASTTKGGA